MWSPSQTNLWLECPLKWAKRRAGEHETSGKWHPAQLVGTALHVGWGSYLDPAQIGEEQESRLLGAARALTGALQGEWPDSTGEWEYEAVEGLALKCLERIALKWIPGLLEDGGQVLGTEVQLGPGDRATGQYPGTADLITQHGRMEPYLVVTDYKTHWTMDGERASRAGTQTERNWQLTQYAHFAQEKFGLPVKYLRALHVTVTPNPRAWPYACPVSQDRLKKWREHAEGIWWMMDMSWSWPNWDSCEKYGAAFRCGYYNDCHGGG